MMLPVVAAALLTVEGAPNATAKLALLDFQSVGTSPELTGAVQGVVAHELENLGVFQVTTGESVRALIAQERQKEILGACGEGACKGFNLNALQADYLVGGRVTHAGKTFTLELSLLSVAQNKREDSDVEAAHDEADLVNVASVAATKVVRKLLATRSGSLIIVSSESGAEVKVDGTTVGTTPLEGRLTLPAGVHRLVVSKDAFIAYRKDVRTAPDSAVEENAVLVPSSDFITQHREKSGRMRLGAYITSGVVVAGLGAGFLFQGIADKSYGSTSSPNTFLYDRARLQAGDESVRTQATGLQTKISTDQTLSAVSFAVALAAAAGAAYFWIWGDDPGRYDKFRLMPAGSGGAAAFSF